MVAVARERVMREKVHGDVVRFCSLVKPVLEVSIDLLPSDLDPVVNKTRDLYRSIVMLEGRLNGDPYVTIDCTQVETIAQQARDLVSGCSAETYHYKVIGRLAAAGNGIAQAIRLRHSVSCGNRGIYQRALEHAGVSSGLPDSMFSKE